MLRISHDPAVARELGAEPLPAQAQRFAPAPRVLVVGTHPTKTRGGITTVINGLLSSPAAAEFDFRYVASQADEYGRWSKLLLAAWALARFSFLLAVWRPQLVYIHVGSNASLYRKSVFLMLARAAGRRVAAHFHAGDFLHYYDRQRRAGQWLIRSGLNCSHRLIAVSRASAGLLRNLLPQSDIALVPNGIDLSPFAGSARGNDDCVRLLFVGAMRRLKGERDLVAAMRCASEQAPHLRLLMLGHGGEGVEAACRATGLASLIEHLGPVPMNERCDYFRRADIFVLPSYGEGMPMSLLEALAAGLPVVATNVGGIPELVQDGENGFLIEPGDVKALAERLARLANDAALRRRMGERSRVMAQAFALERVTAQLVDELRRAL